MGDGVGGAGSEREVSGEREPEGGQVQAVTGVAVKGGGGGGGPPPGGGVTGGGGQRMGPSASSGSSGRTPPVGPAFHTLPPVVSRPGLGGPGPESGVQLPPS